MERIALQRLGQTNSGVIGVLNLLPIMDSGLEQSTLEREHAALNQLTAHRAALIGSAAADDLLAGELFLDLLVHARGDAHATVLWFYPHVLDENLTGKVASAFPF